MYGGEHRFTVFRMPGGWYLAIELYLPGEPLAQQYWTGWGKSSYEAIAKLCSRTSRGAEGLHGSPQDAEDVTTARTGA